MASIIENFGADPAIIKWTVIRGDSSSIRLDFLENDEVTHYDTDSWIYKASAYDPKTDILDDLQVTPGDGYVDVKISPALSSNWGTGYKSQIAELTFDVEVTIGETVWTPVTGIISVLGDVSGTL
jgi:hypothetical protein